MSSSKTTVFSSRKIITMDPSNPTATHVAVRDGRILSAGSLERTKAWGDFDLDERFADRVLMPGLVEGHCHLMAGGLWMFPYVGFHERTGPDGRRWAGCRSFDDVVQRLREAHEAMGGGEEPLIAWGFDPIFFSDERMSVRHLDQVSTSRPVVILHASQHLMNVNSATLRKAGITRDTEVEGVVKMDDGDPSGELQEFAAMFSVARLIGNLYQVLGTSETGLRLFGQLSQRAGVTTATDLVNDLASDNVELLQRLTAEPDYPVRLVPAYAALDGSVANADGAARVRRRQKENTDKLFFGPVKLVADGSIQGFTARLRWPGYFNGHENGTWILPPSELRTAIDYFHAQGFQLHIHTNGDEATDLALDAVEAALARHPRADHRHTLQHCQMADAAQYRRMARLGMCVNLFANHLYYWGDAHRSTTLGPDRAGRMNACATALRHGIPLAIHSDTPVTPLGPLFTAWCAVNRLTVGGQVLGQAERISVADALHAITLGAAYTLRLDHRIGSIETGKLADFCVLDRDPLEVAPEALKDVRVLGTVLGGRPLPLPGA